MASFSLPPIEEDLLSRKSLNQLANLSAVGSRVELRRLLTRVAFDQTRGIYVPVSDDVKLIAKAPTFSEKLASATTDMYSPFYSYFANCLTIPKGWVHASKQGRMDRMDPPTLRLSNPGWLIATIEYDAKDASDFEEMLSWVRGTDGRGRESPFVRRVDAELCSISEYRGYSVVFSGSRSLHFHFMFSTAHLTHAPSAALATARLENQHVIAPLMDRAHARCWQQCEDEMSKLSGEPSDSSMKTATQWKRAPWGVRVLDKESPVFGWPAGSQVPQIVLLEDLRNRRSPKANKVLLDQSFACSHPQARIMPPRNSIAPAPLSHPAEAIAILEELCRLEWQLDYPKPVSIEQTPAGYTIHFRNSETDQRPSTVVIGPRDRLNLAGEHNFGNRRFELPDGMTANQLAEHALIQVGINIPRPGTPPVHHSAKTSFEHQKNDRRSLQARIAELSIREPIDDRPRDDYIQNYRRKLSSLILQTRDMSNRIIVLSGEGIGKTTSLRPIVTDESRDVASAAAKGFLPFAAVAVKSLGQAERKADEFRAAGSKAFVFRSLYSHYEAACRSLSESPLPRNALDQKSAAEVLESIRSRQRNVYSELEKIRRGLWPDRSFSSYSTILITSHGTVQAWDRSHVTRAWHHPSFDPSMAFEQERELAERIMLERVVFDDPEAADFFHCLSELEFNALKAVPAHNWRGLSRTARKIKHNSILHSLPESMRSFETFDQLMRLPIGSFQQVLVDTARDPFGGANAASCIYKKCEGDHYFLRPQEWVAGNRHMTFLTTEKVVAATIEGVLLLARQGQVARNRRTGPTSRRLSIDIPLRLNLDDLPGIYPIPVPTRIDARANKRKVAVLVDEILNEDRGCLVISDSACLRKDVLNFQRMKGANGHENRNVHIVMMALNPGQYAKLNVLGQWLKIDDIVSRHYFDQLAQAVGRNRGFREAKGKKTTTEVHTSSKVWRSVLSNPRGLSNRVVLHELVKPKVP